MTDRTSLIQSLETYKTRFPEEAPFIPRFLELLKHPRAFHRDHLPGHITGSAWIVDSSRSHVLLVEHGNLRKWLQPGGHADGDENVLRVALREANEETGVTELRSIHDTVFDVDIHRIPARKDLSFPEHDHYDIRFLFEADRQASLLISDESTDLRWISLADLEQYNKEQSVLRLREKLRF